MKNNNFLLNILQLDIKNVFVKWAILVHIMFYVIVLFFGVLLSNTVTIHDDTVEYLAGPHLYLR